MISSAYAVVVVNWHGTEDVMRCLDAFAASQICPWLVVVDNSGDGVLATAVGRRSASDFFRLVDAGGNIGFGRASNQGASLALELGAKYVMFLNPDTSFSVNRLMNLFERLEASPDIGAIGPVVLNSDGTVQSCGARVSKWTLAVRELESTEETPEFITGACLAVSAHTVEQYGPFDEKFFMYWEDVNLCFRLAKMGLRIVVDPSVEIYHARSVTHKRAGVAIDRYQARSVVVFVALQGWPWYVGGVFRILLRIGRRVAAGRFRAARAVVEGSLEGIMAYRLPVIRVGGKM